MRGHLLWLKRWVLIHRPLSLLYLVLALFCKLYIGPISFNSSCSRTSCTYGWVTAHMDESRHTWMSHGTHESDVSHVNESCHIWMSHVKFERSHVTYEFERSRVAYEMHQSCSPTHWKYGWVMAHMDELLIICIWLNLGTHESVVPHMNESCPTWMSPVTHEWMSPVTHGWVMSHMNE